MSRDASTPAGAKSPAGYGRIVWIDCEMTGLDFDNDQLVEIAVIVTDADLNPLDEGMSAVIKAPQDLLDSMDPVVVEMHNNSGLIHEIPDGVSLAEAESLALDYVRTHIAEPEKAPLAGSSVYVDRAFLSRQMPDLDAYLNYRLIDVSSLKELAKRWAPKLYFTAPDKNGNHRALGDILDSIAELEHYREKLLNGPPPERSPR